MALNLFAAMKSSMYVGTFVVMGVVVLFVSMVVIILVVNLIRWVSTPRRDDRLDRPTDRTPPRKTNGPVRDPQGHPRRQS